jgi:hypothetical protein
VNASDVLIDGFGRIHGVVHRVVGRLSADDLAFRPSERANSIAWLVWHLARIQDDHVSEVAGADQVWTSGGWYQRFGLPFAPADTGYGHTPQDVAAVTVESGQLLVGYHDAVYEQTLAYLRRLEPGDLPAIVDERWDPPVSLAVRLVSVLADDLQHAGQAAYVRGLLPTRAHP